MPARSGDSRARDAKEGSDYDEYFEHVAANRGGGEDRYGETYFTVSSGVVRRYGSKGDLKPAATEAAARKGDFRWMKGEPDKGDKKKKGDTPRDYEDVKGSKKSESHKRHHDSATDYTTSSTDSEDSRYGGRTDTSTDDHRDRSRRHGRGHLKEQSRGHPKEQMPNGHLKEQMPNGHTSTGSTIHIHNHYGEQAAPNRLSGAHPPVGPRAHNRGHRTRDRHSRRLHKTHGPQSLQYQDYDEDLSGQFAEDDLGYLSSSESPWDWDSEDHALEVALKDTRGGKTKTSTNPVKLHKSRGKHHSPRSMKELHHRLAKQLALSASPRRRAYDAEDLYDEEYDDYSRGYGRVGDKLTLSHGVHYAPGVTTPPLPPQQLERELVEAVSRGEAAGAYVPHNKPPTKPKKPLAVQGDAAKADTALQKANPVVGAAIKKVATELKSNETGDGGEGSKEGAVKSVVEGMIDAKAALPYAETAPRAVRAGAPDVVPVPINEQAAGKLSAPIELLEQAAEAIDTHQSRMEAAKQLRGEWWQNASSSLARPFAAVAHRGDKDGISYIADGAMFVPPNASMHASTSATAHETMPMRTEMYGAHSQYDERHYSSHGEVSFGGYSVEMEDLCYALWLIAKDSVYELPRIFAKYDARKKGYLRPKELRAMLRALDPEADERQLDRVEAMIVAEHPTPPSAGQEELLPAVTLDILVRAALGGYSAAAKLSTPKGCAQAAQLVAQLEYATAASPHVFDRALSSFATRRELASKPRRNLLHRAMLQVVPHAMLKSSITVDEARLLVAALDSPAGVHAGTGPRDLLASEPGMLAARLRSLSTELIRAANAPHPPRGVYTKTGRDTVLAPERITAAAEGVQELDNAYRRFRVLESEVLGHAMSGTGEQTPEQVLEEVKKQIAAAVKAAGDAEAKSTAHLDRYYQWTYAQRSQIMSYWADTDMKRREAAALKISKEKELKAKTGKEAVDRGAAEATAAMKAMEVEMKKNVGLYQTAMKKEMGLLEAEIKKIIAHNKDVMVIPPPIPKDEARAEVVSKSLDVALAEAAQRTAHARSAAAAMAQYAPTRHGRLSGIPDVPLYEEFRIPPVFDDASSMLHWPYTYRDPAGMPYASGNWLGPTGTYDVYGSAASVSRK